jgi:hypothetical protein
MADRKHPDQVEANPERPRLRMNPVKCETDGVAIVVVDTKESKRDERDTENPL